MADAAPLPLHVKIPRGLRTPRVVVRNELHLKFRCRPAPATEAFINIPSSTRHLHSKSRLEPAPAPPHPPCSSARNCAGGRRSTSHRPRRRRSTRDHSRRRRSTRHRPRRRRSTRPRPRRWRRLLRAQRDNVRNKNSEVASSCGIDSKHIPRTPTRGHGGREG